MNVGKTLFAQVMEFVPWKTFGRIVERHKGDAGVRTLSCADLFRVMAFAQLTWRESLRDIEVCLASNQGKLFHMGMKAPPARSTLAADAVRAKLACSSTHPSQFVTQVWRTGSRGKVSRRRGDSNARLGQGVDASKRRDVSMAAAAVADREGEGSSGDDHGEAPIPVVQVAPGTCTVIAAPAHLLEEPEAP